MDLNGKKIRAIMLIGPLDFGRQALSSAMSSVLWPIIDTPAICSLVEQLSEQGINKITICCKQQRKLFEKALSSIDENLNVEIDIVVEDLPAGTAGSFRLAANKDDDILLVLPGAMTMLPDMKHIVEQHISQGNDMTVLFNKPSSSSDKVGDCGDIYICNSSVLDCIAEEGYCDIKETLIPELGRDNKKVGYVVVDSRVGLFRNCETYFKAMARFIASDKMRQCQGFESKQTDTARLYIADEAKVDPTARFFGDVVISNGAIIGNDTVVVGPTVISENVELGNNCVISNSMLWPFSKVGSRSRLENTLVGYNTRIVADSEIRNESLTAVKPMQSIRHADRPKAGVIDKVLSSIHDSLSVGYINHYLVEILTFIAILIAFIWSYSTTLTDIKDIWFVSDEYSAGLLVPFLVGHMACIRRDKLCDYSLKPAIFTGLIVFLSVQAFRFFGLFFNYGSAEKLSVIGTIAAAVILMMGWKLFFKLLPLLVFMLLMLPLPAQINTNFSLLLQNWATDSAVWLLEAIGFVVRQEGNIIHIGDTTVAVAEACNGLRMITAFFIIAGWCALIVNRKWWEKFIVILSALPIAILCNTIRLAATSIAFTMIDAEKWAQAFHDYGGFAMMPLAIAIIFAELWLLKNIFIAPEKA